MPRTMQAVMKAVDLGREIDWTAKDPFSQLGWMFGRNTEWRVEPKIDGIRCTLEFDHRGGMLITSRNGIDRTTNFPHLVAGDLLPRELSGTILDCELTARWHDGEPMLPATTALVVANRQHAETLQRLEGPAVLNVFDVLAVAGKASVTLSYLERRELLVQLKPLLEATGYMRVVPSWIATKDRCHKILGAGYEGVMLKLCSSTYRTSRTRAWLKMKRRATLDAVITGYTPGKGQHENKVGSLEISLYCLDTMTWVKVGSVGNLSDLLRQRCSTKTGRLSKTMYGKVVEVIAQGVGNHGHLRSPQLVGFRTDKPELECTTDQLSAFPRV